MVALLHVVAGAGQPFHSNAQRWYKVAAEQMGKVEEDEEV